MNNQKLYEQLIEYSKRGRYPFHMPGHKRQSELWQGVNAFDMDITEIEGFDNLHHAHGIIKEAMDNASEYFKTERTWFLVNGSSCGILAAISAVTNNGDDIIIGRNCHKSVYNAVWIRNLNVEYIYPDYIKEYGINGGYNPEKLEEVLKKAQSVNKQIKAVVITSPTYDGIVSDVEKIAEVVHRHGAVLIVDEAHGAHFGISGKFPMPAYQCGADLVIESTHKTLPALTQTALLHMGSNRVDAEKIEEYLSVYQTSSPSYLLMASIDRCVEVLQHEGEETAENLLITLRRFRERVNKLTYIHVPGEQLVGRYNIFDVDLTKLVISIEEDALTGKELSDILRRQYSFEMEMESVKYVLAITTICDNLDEIDRLAESLEEIDKNLSKKDNENKCIEFNLTANQVVCFVNEAKKRAMETVDLNSSKGRISAEYLYVYPPEIPLLVPGEIISDKLLEQIESFKKMKLNINGPVDIGENKIKVIRDEN
jgi:arginine/lysine/ornithine decarboxylase